MTGIPVVALGPTLGNSPYELGQQTYEIPDLIENGVDGFWSDDVVLLRKYCERLLNDLPFAKAIGEAGRRKAIKIFGKETIKKQWKEFFNGLSK